MGDSMHREHRMIETDRLTLSIPTIDDFEPFHAILSQPEVYRFIGAGPSPRPESWVRFLRSVGHWSLYGYGLFAIRSKATGEYVGETGTAHFERDLGTDFDPYPESAWLLGANSHGKGYATEAAEAALRWFLQLKGQQRTVCIIDPKNVGSLRVAEKLGYQPIDEREYREKPVIAFERLP